MLIRKVITKDMLKCLGSEADKMVESSTKRTEGKMGNMPFTPQKMEQRSLNMLENILMMDIFILTCEKILLYLIYVSLRIKSLIIVGEQIVDELSMEPLEII